MTKLSHDYIKKSTALVHPKIKGDINNIRSIKKTHAHILATTKTPTKLRNNQYKSEGGYCVHKVSLVYRHWLHSSLKNVCVHEEKVTKIIMGLYENLRHISGHDINTWKVENPSV